MQSATDKDKRPDHSIEPDTKERDQKRGGHEVDAPAARVDDESKTKTTVREE